MSQIIGPDSNANVEVAIGFGCVCRVFVCCPNFFEKKYFFGGTFKMQLQNAKCKMLIAKCKCKYKFFARTQNFLPKPKIFAPKQNFHSNPKFSPETQNFCPNLKF